MKTEEVAGFLNKLESEEKTFRAVRREIGELVPAYLEAKKGLDEVDAQNISLRAHNDSLILERQNLEQSIKVVREKFAEAKTQLQARQADHAKIIAEIDALIEMRQQKLTAIESAISERAGQLGGLIARELT